MYLKNKEKRITVRLNEAQYKYLKESADTLEMQPSDFLRLVIDTTRATNKAMTKVVSHSIFEITRKIKKNENV